MAEGSKPAGGLRMSGAERYLALALVEEMLLKGHRKAAILAELSEQGYTESDATTTDWMQEIYRRWAAEDVERRPARKDLWRARLEARYLMMMEDLSDPKMNMQGINRAKLYDAMAKLELLAIKLDGLDAPIRVEHSGTVDIRAMAPDERRARIDELLAKRDAARKRIPTGLEDN